jgi:predicted unusual protein kinase regulating ubiquinone biosynthesis (AarF/ABC1/UbiB family)
VREHVEGALLRDVWGRDPAAEEALAGFLAEMERRGVLHGDLHPQNLLWTGVEWVLLDVDGLRHALHGRKRVLTGQWARFLLHLPERERVRALHRRTGELLAASGARPVPWEDVHARAEALRARRAAPGSSHH